MAADAGGVISRFAGNGITQLSGTGAQTPCFAARFHAVFHTVQSLVHVMHFGFDVIENLVLAITQMRAVGGDQRGAQHIGGQVAGVNPEGLQFGFYHLGGGAHTICGVTFDLIGIKFVKRIGCNARA
ncbi:hypothetical protein GALL_517430 [mine drainage metagenome]|uniref:Uncharacterized protein n=1 Tax=mine drainage metagenome TaxID=410659 RepID=A0A1J5PGK2_9ZZZZ